MEKQYLEVITKFFSFLKNYWQSLIISLYIGLGIALMIIIHANAYTYQKEIGPISYKFTYEVAIILALIWFIIFSILSFIILVKSKRRIISGGLISTMIMVLGLLAFRLIDGGLNIHNFTYILFESLLAFLIVMIFKDYSVDKQLSHTGNPSNIEVLKLQHKEILEYIHLLSFLALIFFLSGVIGVFYENISAGKDNPNALALMVYNHLFLYLYFVLGFGFGIIGQLLQKLGQIKEQIMNYKSDS
jgi:hypothetical protein